MFANLENYFRSTRLLHECSLIRHAGKSHGREMLIFFSAPCVYSFRYTTYVIKNTPVVRKVRQQGSGSRGQAAGVGSGGDFSHYLYCLLSAFCMAVYTPVNINLCLDQIINGLRWSIMVVPFRGSAEGVTSEHLMNSSLHRITIISTK